LRVTTSVDFGVAFLAPLVREFLQRYPSMICDVHLSNEPVDLVKESVDVAVRMASRRLLDSTMQARRVARLELALVASPTYLEAAPPIRAPKDLSLQQWVLFRSIEAIRLEGPSGMVRLVPQGRVTFNDMLAVREAVRSGAGVGLLPVMLCAEELESGRLVRLLPRWRVPSTDVWCLWQQSRTTHRKTAAFVDFLASKLAR
jgi:DNA-binding transcriptional LysR family regulator